jgi:hypothetical protein
MLRSLKEIIGYSVHAKDGDIGKVINFYFDDQRWIIRYLVADTGGWLSGKKVIISPAGFYDKPDWANHSFPVAFTKDMVKECPDVDADKPISRRYEEEISKYYNWPIYWEAFPQSTVSPIAPAMETMESEIYKPREERGDMHLRSAKEVIGYHIQAEDGSIGHIDDFIIEDDSWDIRYLVVDTRNWLPGRKVLIAPLWVKNVSWAESKVFVDFTKEQIKMSPEYDPSAPVNRGYEDKLYDFYGRPKYWS